MPSQPSLTESSPKSIPGMGSVRWGYDPWASPWRGALPLLIAAAVVAVVVSLQSGWRTQALLMAALVLVAGWRVLIPATYEIGPIGVKAQTLWRRKRIAWRDMGRIEIGKGGIFLSPPASHWGVLRGLYLPWLGHREEVLAALQRYAGPLPVEIGSQGNTRTVSAAQPGPNVVDRDERIDPPSTKPKNSVES